MKNLEYKATLEGNPLVYAGVSYPVIRGNAALSAAAKAHAQKTLKYAAGTFKNAARTAYISALRKCESFGGFLLYEMYERENDRIIFTCYIYDGKWHKKTATVK